MIRELRSIHVILALLTAGVVLQMGVVMQQYAWPRLVELQSLRGRPAWYRSAAIRTSVKGAEFVRFLREEIPIGSRVILPTTVGDSPFYYPGITQYYLFPRTIIACKRSALGSCMEMFGPAFILQTNGFPDAGSAPPEWQRIAYDAKSGIFVVP
jgi:hypothetical protein